MSARAVPILPSIDFDDTLAFYQPLGFTVVGRWPDAYLILSHATGIELHFWFHPGEERASNNVSCFVRFDNLDEWNALYEACRATGLPPAESRAIPRLHAPGTAATDQEWALIDVHGNLVRFGVFAPN